MTTAAGSHGGEVRAVDMELTAGDLFLLLRRYGILICVGAVLAAAAAAGISLAVPKRYQATTLLAAVSSQPAVGGLGRLLGNGSPLGGVASLAGLSLSGDGSRAEVVATLQSELLTRKFIEDNGLLPVLFAKDWDSSAGAWRSGRSHTTWEATRLFRRKIESVTDSAKTDLITMTISWGDAETAAKWINERVRLANEFLRNRAISESEKNLAYLRKQLEQTPIVELRNSIASLMEAEIKSQMIAQGNEYFALRVVDPAIAPEKASSPRRVLWVITGFLMGMFLAVGLVLLREVGLRQRTIGSRGVP